MGRSRHARGDKSFKQKRIDTYEDSAKRRGPLACSECGAIFNNGRWSWDEAPRHVLKTTCPACQRTIDNYPAGFVEISGDFFMEHHEEIMNLIRREGAERKKQRPLERIMSVSVDKDHTLVATTGIHIARRIGEALSRAYQGELNFQYGDAEKSIRVYWSR